MAATKSLKKRAAPAQQGSHVPKRPKMTAATKKVSSKGSRESSSKSETERSMKIHRKVPVTTSKSVAQDSDGSDSDVEDNGGNNDLITTFEEEDVDLGAIEGEEAGFEDSGEDDEGGKVMRVGETAPQKEMKS